MWHRHDTHQRTHSFADLSSPGRLGSSAALNATLAEIADRIATNPRERADLRAELQQIAKTCAMTCPEAGPERAYFQNLLKLADPHSVTSAYRPGPVPGIRGLVANAFETAVDRRIDDERRWDFLKGHLIEASVAANALTLHDRGYELLAVSVRSYRDRQITSPRYDERGGRIPGTSVAREVDMVIDFDEGRIPGWYGRVPKHRTYFVETKASPRVFVDANTRGKHQALALEDISHYMTSAVAGGGNIFTAIVLNDLGFLDEHVSSVDSILAGCTRRSAGNTRPELWNRSFQKIDLSRFR